MNSIFLKIITAFLIVFFKISYSFSFDAPKSAMYDDEEKNNNKEGIRLLEKHSNKTLLFKEVSPKSVMYDDEEKNNNKEEIRLLEKYSNKTLLFKAVSPKSVMHEDEERNNNKGVQNYSDEIKRKKNCWNLVQLYRDSINLENKEIFLKNIFKKNKLDEKKIYTLELFIDDEFFEFCLKENNNCISLFFSDDFLYNKENEKYIKMFHTFKLTAKFKNTENNYYNTLKILKRLEIKTLDVYLLENHFKNFFMALINVKKNFENLILNSFSDLDLNFLLKKIEKIENNFFFNKIIVDNSKNNSSLNRVIIINLKEELEKRIHDKSIIYI